MRKICLKLIRRTPEVRQLSRSSPVLYEETWRNMEKLMKKHIVLVLPLLTWKKQIPAGHNVTTFNLPILYSF